MCNFITLTTDFGYKDNFVGVVKGVIYNINPDAKIVDLCHEVSPQDIMGAAFALKTAYNYFPKGTIHLVVIDPGVGTDRLPILVKTKDYYFIGPDNGVLSLALEEQKVEGIIYLDNFEHYLMPVSNTFHARDIFAPVAAQLTQGISYPLFGRAIKEYKKINLVKIKISARVISGEVIYIDRFGNLITNIGQDLEKNIQGSIIKIKNKAVKGLKTSYADAVPKELLAIFGSSGFLEIAVNLGSAKDKLKAKIGDKVSIFSNGKN